MSAEAMTESQSVCVPLVVRSASRPRRREALRGVKLGLRSHSGFATHIFTSALMIAGAITLDCEAWEWAVLLGGLGGLFAAELFHGVVRHLIQRLESMPDGDRERCKAMAAGAMLIMRLTALGLALLIFGRRLGDVFQLLR